jgi:hypothetical protein
MAAWTRLFVALLRKLPVLFFYVYTTDRKWTSKVNVNSDRYRAVNNLRLGYTVK